MIEIFFNTSKYFQNAIVIRSNNVFVSYNEYVIVIIF